MIGAIRERSDVFKGQTFGRVHKMFVPSYRIEVIESKDTS